MAKKLSKIPAASSTTKVAPAAKPLKKVKVSTFNKAMLEYRLKENPNGKKKY